MRSKEEIEKDTATVRKALRKTPKSKADLVTETRLPRGTVDHAIVSLLNAGTAEKIGDKKHAAYKLA